MYTQPFSSADLNTLLGQLSLPSHRQDLNNLYNLYKYAHFDAAKNQFEHPEALDLIYNTMNNLNGNSYSISGKDKDAIKNFFKTYAGMVDAQEAADTAAAATAKKAANAAAESSAAATSGLGNGIDGAGSTIFKTLAPWSLAIDVGGKVVNNIAHGIGTHSANKANALAAALLAKQRGGSQFSGNPLVQGREVGAVIAQERGARDKNIADTIGNTTQAVTDTLSGRLISGALSADAVKNGLTSGSQMHERRLLAGGK